MSIGYDQEREEQLAAVFRDIGRHYRETELALTLDMIREHIREYTPLTKSNVWDCPAEYPSGPGGRLRHAGDR